MERNKDKYLSDSDIVRIVETYSDMLLRIALNRVKSIPDIDVTAPVGSLTVRLTELMSRTEFDQLACYLLVEGEKPVPYSLSEIRMSINGGEALKTKSEMEWEQNHWNRVTPQPVADWNTDNSDTNYLTFPVEGNPLRAGTTFTLTGKLNGEAFALTYDFTEERYEQLRQTQLQEVGAMAAVIDAIPDETIPVNVTRHRRHWKPGKNSAFLCWIELRGRAGNSTYRRTTGVLPCTFAMGQKSCTKVLRPWDDWIFAVILFSMFSAAVKQAPINMCILAEKQSQNSRFGCCKPSSVKTKQKIARPEERFYRKEIQLIMHGEYVNLLAVYYNFFITQLRESRRFVLILL